MSNELAVPESTPLATRVGLPSAEEFNMAEKIAVLAVSSSTKPAHLKSREDAVVAILKGREMGLPPMEAITGLYVVNGKAELMADTALALCHRRVPGFGIDIIRRDDNGSEIVVKRSGCAPAKFSFTAEDARRAGLGTNDVWKKYPRAMLWSRCVSEMGRAYCPDALAGAYSEGEVSTRDIHPADVTVEAPASLPPSGGNEGGGGGGLDTHSQVPDDRRPEANLVPRPDPSRASTTDASAGTATEEWVTVDKRQYPEISGPNTKLIPLGFRWKKDPANPDQPMFQKLVKNGSVAHQDAPGSTESPPSDLETLYFDILARIDKAGDLEALEAAKPSKVEVGLMPTAKVNRIRAVYLEREKELGGGVA